MLKNTDTSPWYKQFWPWFLMMPLFVTVGLSGYMLHTAFTNKGSMVSDQYYKDGLAINAVIDDLLQAKKLGVAGELTLHNERIQLQLSANQALADQQIILQFYHPTDSNKDQQVALISAGNGLFVANLPQLSKGKWYLDVTNTQGTPWRLKNAFQYPFERLRLTP